MTPHEQILEELCISRKAIDAGEKVIPRFHIQTPTGNYTVLMPPDDDTGPRSALFKPIWLFMVWKEATGFILSLETEIPHVLTAIFVSRRGAIGAQQFITRAPLSFSEPKWLGGEALGKEIIALLPPASVPLSEADMATILDWEANGLLALTLN